MPSIFSHSEFDHHEQVVFFHCEKTGLKAIVAVHNTNLGPALGGCRMWDYKSDGEAIYDVLRLSKGMTYKAAAAGLPLGGGKAVIIGNAKTDKTPELFEAMGKKIDSMGGAYISAEDVGIKVEDVNIMASQTQYVTGTTSDSQFSGGDPSPVTAYGVYLGLQAAVKKRLNASDVKGMRIAVQGVGNVGYNLCKYLYDEGAELVVTDTSQEQIDRVVQDFGATVVFPEDIYTQDVDVLSPCALGAVLNNNTIPKLKAKVIAGAANNQLESEEHGQALADRGILYTPDFVINAGGLINVYHEYVARRDSTPYDREAVFAYVEKISETTESIFRVAEDEGIPTNTAANKVAEERFR